MKPTLFLSAVIAGLLLFAACAKPTPDPINADLLPGTWFASFAAADTNGNKVLDPQERIYYTFRDTIITTYKKPDTLFAATHAGTGLDTVATHWRLVNGGGWLRFTSGAGVPDTQYVRIHTLNGATLILEDTGTLSPGSRYWYGFERRE